MTLKSEDSKSRSNTSGISTDPKILHLIQLNDTAFPMGNYSHSFGMETYIQEGKIRDAEDLKVFCDMYLHDNLVTGDAIIFKEAYKLAKNEDLKGLIHLEKICHGIKLSPEARSGSSMLGRQFLQTISPLTESELLKTWQEKLKDKEIKGHFAVIYGIYTAILDVEQQMALETFLYSSVTSLVQNAVRAVPLGQTSGVKTIFSLLPEMQEAAERVMEMDLDNLDNNSVGLEISSIQHEFLNSRLFIS